jgi:hypothetical protein
MALSDLERLISEGDDRTMRDEALRAEIYTELDWVRYQKKWKPGWTATKYKELFGAWPPAWMKSLTPRPPRKAVLLLVNRWGNRFKRERKKEEQNDH